MRPVREIKCVAKSVVPDPKRSPLEMAFQNTIRGKGKPQELITLHLISGLIEKACQCMGISFPSSARPQIATAAPFALNHENYYIISR
jgi:hypothetical protein